MSAQSEFKIAATTNPVQTLKIGSNCYNLVKAAVVGTPEVTIDDIDLQGSYASCTACNASGNVPNTCPSGLLSTYKINISTPTMGSCYPAARDTTRWPGIVSSYGSCDYRYEVGENYTYPTTSTINFYDVGTGSSIGHTAVAMLLRPSYYWIVWALCGTCRGIWLKRDGATPIGLYETIGNGETEPLLNLTCSWVKPTSITVEENV